MKNCKHPTCHDECRREKKQKARTPVNKTSEKQHPLLLKKAAAAFNLFIRLRDKDKPCICGCGQKVQQAGHFFPAGSYSGVMFDEVNVNGISLVCNYFKNTAAIDPEYEAGLIARVGMATVRQLQQKADETRLYKWSRQELEQIIETYKNKIKPVSSAKQPPFTENN